MTRFPVRFLPSASLVRGSHAPLAFTSRLLLPLPAVGAAGASRPKVKETLNLGTRGRASKWLILNGFPGAPGSGRYGRAGRGAHPPFNLAGEPWGAPNYWALEKWEAVLVSADPRRWNRAQNRLSAPVARSEAP